MNEIWQSGGDEGAEWLKKRKLIITTPTFIWYFKEAYISGKSKLELNYLLL